MRLLLFALALSITAIAYGQRSYLFIGTYTASGSKGIYVYRFNAKTGSLTLLSNTEGITNPSYLALAPDKKHLYACTDTRTQNPGTISAFSFDKKTGKLSFINKQTAGGANPVYLAVHKSGKWVVEGNYTGGNLSVLKINPDGSLQPPSQTIAHSGNSINAERQDKSHVHCTVFSPDYRYVYVPDLGIDKVMAYAVQENESTPLLAAPAPFTAAIPGSGPRHLTFHPNGKYAYLIEELAGAVVVYRYNPASGALDSLQEVLTHPAAAQDPFGAADVHVSKDGKFLYASNRANENNLAVFSIAESGQLTLVGYQPTLGKMPRNFTLDPSGKFVLVANQESNNVVVFRRNLHTGLLTPTGTEISVPEPSCLQMIKE